MKTKKSDKICEFLLSKKIVRDGIDFLDEHPDLSIILDVFCMLFASIAFYYIMAYCALF